MPGGVLGQRLVDPDADLLPGRHLALDEVRLDQLLGDVASHGVLLGTRGWTLTMAHPPPGRSDSCAGRPLDLA